ncbi:MAG: hypothetical protein HWE15_12745 [Algoriphagus sp.]|uniref:hypothetical protein n=1 Tax=Algoriphagus sp. TaxID=1872435 RepID=UPI0017954B19|nr:hypothetical protein [Algoriphagus sp.]NVJ87171.1 hypothetical protein [Algoriphagus sp.]
MDQKAQFPIFPMHFRGLLLLAGMYTVAWSAFFNWFGPELIAWLAESPGEVFDLPAKYYGMFGIVVGLVLFVSAFYPVSWVYLILAGITGKVILAIWFSLGFLPELGWNKRTGFHLIVNELLWLIPLVIIFLRALQVKEYLRKQEE